MIVYIEIYNVDKEKKCYILFEQIDEYKINLDTNLLDGLKKASIDMIKNKLTQNLNIEILDNELTYLGYDNDGTHFLCLQTFLRKKHISKLKKYIKNIKDDDIKITYFRNKKKINKLFLYDMKLYSLYRKFMIHETIKYDVKELGLF
jgi:hypothetical protein